MSRAERPREHRTHWRGGWKGCCPRQIVIGSRVPLNAVSRNQRKVTPNAFVGARGTIAGCGWFFDCGEADQESRMSSTHEPPQLLEPTNLLEPLDLEHQGGDSRPIGARRQRRNRRTGAAPVHSRRAPRPAAERTRATLAGKVGFACRRRASLLRSRHAVFPRRHPHALGCRLLANDCKRESAAGSARGCGGQIGWVNPD